MYSRETLVLVRPFSRQQDGDEVIIGSPETGVFLAVPPDAVELLEDLAGGKSIGEASDSYQKKHGEVPDMEDLLTFMEGKGMVVPASRNNGIDVSSAQSQQAVKRRYHFENVSQALAERIFGRVSVALCFIAAAAALGAMIRDSWLVPTATDLYFPDRRALNWTVLIAVNYATIFVHELGHLIAARAAGISSRIGISHRLWYLVAETDLTGLWAVPKRQRYLPMFAGMVVDLFSVSLLVLLLFLYRLSWIPIGGFWVHMIRALELTYWLRLMWQFFLFVRTDIYYVIAALFNCKNLLGDTAVFLRNLLARFIPWIRAVDQSGIPAAERRMIRIYAAFWLGGRVWAACVLLLVTVPVCLKYMYDLGAALRTGYSANPSDFMDAVAVTTYFLVPTLGGLIQWIAGLARRKGSER